MSVVRYPDHTEINVDRLVQSSYRLSGVSGTRNLRTLRPYVHPTEYNRIALFLEQFHLGLASEGCGFQFLELFLSDLLYRTWKTEPKPVAEFHLLHSSAIREVQSKGTSRFEVMDATKENKFFASHPSELPIREIKNTIARLRRSCMEYLDTLQTPRAVDPWYEFYRYFCAKTLLTYFCSPDTFGFQKNGIRSFFDRLFTDRSVDPPGLELVRFVRSEMFEKGTIVPKPLRECIATTFERDFKGQFPNRQMVEPFEKRYRGGDGKLQKAIALISKISESADLLALMVIEHRHAMPVECYGIFFGFSANEYHPWIRAASISRHDNDVQYYLPDRVLKEERERISKTINYASYDHYLTVFKNFLIGKDASTLGVMLVAPFHVDTGRHSGSGFIRAMRRFDAKTGELVLDSYVDNYLKGDQQILGELADTFSHEFSKNLGNLQEFLKGGE